MENEEIRKAGEYTITQSIKIGDKELVLGEDFSNKEGLFYMVANYEELFGVVGRYDNVMVSDDFLGIVELFSKRLYGFRLPPRHQTISTQCLSTRMWRTKTRYL